MVNPPKVLIFILYRGKGNSFDCDVKFGETLDIKEIVANKNSSTIYELVGIISHLGESGEEGHFIAYCKHFDFSWYFFNDGIVLHVPSISTKKGTPYILFYHLKEKNNDHI